MPVVKDALGKVSKVTTPIMYRDPRAYFARDLQKRLAKKGVNADVIKKAVLKVEEYAKASPREKAYTIGFLAEALLRHSAQKIYLVDLSGKLTEDIIFGVPDYLKNRIIWADRDRTINRRIEQMLSPISNEVQPLWNKMRKMNSKKYSGINDHEHGLCLIEEFLLTLTIATKYNTEADVDLSIVRGAIKRVQRQIKTSESLGLLSRIEGIANCYQISRRIPNLVVSGKPTPKDLLKDLLDDARMISLSRSRYLLGIPSRFEIGLIKVRQKVREFLSDRRNREYLVAATKVGNIAVKYFHMEIPEIDVEQENVFAPPLISLDTIKPNCLSIHRRLPTVFPN